MSKMANSLSLVDYQTHRGYGIINKKWYHKPVDLLREQPPEVSGDLDELFGLLLLISLTTSLLKSEIL